MNIQNIKEAEELLIKYRSITLEYLNSMSTIHTEDKLKTITGFGSLTTCTLCVALGGDYCDCNNCIYSIITDDDIVCYCCNDIAEDTYNNILSAKSDEELIIAINNRANFLESILKRIKDND